MKKFFKLTLLLTAALTLASCSDRSAREHKPGAQTQPDAGPPKAEVPRAIDYSRAPNNQRGSGTPTTAEPPMAVSVESPESGTATPVADTPSVSDAAAFIKRQGYTNGATEVLKIVKTDGVNRPNSGKYVLEYRIELKCLEVYGRGYDNPDLDWGHCRGVGAIQTGKGSLIFIKTERGWRVADEYLAKQTWFDAD